MKRLYVIGGPMGVGKTAVSRALQQRLPNCVFLDGDWCWDMRPFYVTDETKAMVLDNICHLLGNFLQCSVCDNVVFCWVMHRQEILDGLLSRLTLRDVELHLISLTAAPEALEERLQKDIEAGLRKPDVIGRSLSYLPLYEALNTQKLDTTGKTVEQVWKACSCCNAEWISEKPQSCGKCFLEESTVPIPPFLFDPPKRKHAVDGTKEKAAWGAATVWFARPRTLC